MVDLTVMGGCSNWKLVAHDKSRIEERNYGHFQNSEIYVFFKLLESLLSLNS